MNNKLKINIDEGKRNDMINSIRKYFLDEREEDLGDLAANLILDFFIEKLGPEIYNQGIEDSYKYMNHSIEDLLGLQKY